MAKKYYAYILNNGLKKGIVDNWDDCKKIVNGVSCKFMSFKSEDEAVNWIKENGQFKKETVNKNGVLEKGIYFDAGKRSKTSYTRVRVCDHENKDLLEVLQGTANSLKFEGENLLSNKVCIGRDVTVGTYNGNKTVPLNVSATNNVGELVGFILACNIAIKTDCQHKKILGDSKLILDYWSKKIYNKDKVFGTTRDLINKAYELRKDLEKKGFEFLHVSGDINPADLGDHK